MVARSIVGEIDKQALTFLVDAAGVVANRCRACICSRNRGPKSKLSLFMQCGSGHRPGELFCGTHLRSAPHGIWAPEKEHQDLATKTLSLEWINALGRMDAQYSRELNPPKPGRPQKAFVQLSEAERGELRKWGEDPVALPPHPCMLCTKNCATEAEWARHANDEHAGLDPYFRRLFWLLSQRENMGAIKPQLGRHAVEVSSDALVTGSGDWERCGVDVDHAQVL